MKSRVTTLSHALLGLINQRPQSGYALSKMFRTSPLAQYSGSPGAVYPALAKLASAGLIRGRVDPLTPLRPRRVYRITRAGRATLRRWLEPAVTADDVARREPELMLRFALMEGVLGSAEVRRFLETLVSAVATHLRQVEPFLEAPGMTDHGVLALEGGIETLRQRGAWAQRALRELDNSTPHRRAG